MGAYERLPPVEFASFGWQRCAGRNIAFGARATLLSRGESSDLRKHLVCGAWVLSSKTWQVYVPPTARYGNVTYLQWAGVGYKMVSMYYVENSFSADQLRQSELLQKVCVCTRIGLRFCPRQWHPPALCSTGAPGKQVVRPEDEIWVDSSAQTRYTINRDRLIAYVHTRVNGYKFFL